MNRKVPLAILCCFLIAFILQGTLKLCGVFVFDKALDWDIFRIIDSSIFLYVVYYSIFIFISIYCLSFCLLCKPYSKKWWHYVLIAVVSVAMTLIKRFTLATITNQIIYDIIIYVVLPVIINLTADKDNRLIFNDKVTNVVVITSLQILLYFSYMGLNYWSGMLNSIIATTQYVLQPSAMFLIITEVYIGLGLLMLSSNAIISQIKQGGANMFFPVNLSTEEAKEKELEELKEKQENKEKK